MHYIYLLVAIVAEVIATSTLKATEQFTRLLPSVLVLACYAIAFYLLSLIVKTLPVGIVYALWSGLGMVLVAIVGVVWTKQHLDLPAIIGIGLILAGVLILNLYSKAIPH